MSVGFLHVNHKSIKDLEPIRHESNASVKSNCFNRFHLLQMCKLIVKVCKKFLQFGQLILCAVHYTQRLFFSVTIYIALRWKAISSRNGIAHSLELQTTSAVLTAEAVRK